MKHALPMRTNACIRVFVDRSVLPGLRYEELACMEKI